MSKIKENSTGIKELDDIIDRYENESIDLSGLVAEIWNEAYKQGYEARTQFKVIDEDEVTNIK